MGDFEVDTNGRCFLCMDKALSTVKPEPESSPHWKSAVHSLQYLSRYVKLDMSKVFSDGVDVPPDLLAKVAKARLKVELCDDCLSVNESFSKLYKQLEKIELEMSSHIQHLHRKLTKATDAMTNSRIGFDNIDNTEKFKIAEALREEAKQKCFRKVNGAPGPKVQMLKLTMKQVNAERRKVQLSPLRRQRGQKASISRKKSAVSTEAFVHEASDTDPGISKVKEECSSSHLLKGSDTGDDHFDESANVASEDMDQSPSPESVSAIMIPSTNIDVHEASEATDSNCFTGMESITEPKFEMEDGSYKCILCSKRFGSKGAWKIHYRNIHQKIKYKCNLCEIEFALKGTYRRHHQSVHMGIRFKCLVCNKTFTQKGHLTGHQKRSNCKTGKPPKVT